MRNSWARTKCNKTLTTTEQNALRKTSLTDILCDIVLIHDRVDRHRSSQKIKSPACIIYALGFC